QATLESGQILVADGKQAADLAAAHGQGRRGTRQRDNRLTVGGHGELQVDGLAALDHGNAGRQHADLAVVPGQLLDIDDLGQAVVHRAAGCAETGLELVEGVELRRGVGQVKRLRGNRLVDNAAADAANVGDLHAVADEDAAGQDRIAGGKLGNLTVIARRAGV